MQNVDIPIMAAYLLLVAAMFVAINLVVDLLYAVRGSAPARLHASGRLEASVMGSTRDELPARTEKVFPAARLADSDMLASFLSVRS